MTLRCIDLALPDSEEFEGVLQTVTSNRIRKITFNISRATHTDPRINPERWSRLDEMFLTMANMLDGPGEKLEIVFDSLMSESEVPKESSHADHGWFLMKCRTRASIRFEYV